MIERVTCENLRGTTKSVGLTDKNLIIGFNGVGKSTVVHAANLAINGYIPDDQSSNKSADYVFANSSDDVMKVGAFVNEIPIERVWTRGKNITQKVTVNGVAGNKNGAQQMIELAVGKDPVLMDMPAFWNMSPKAQSRFILDAVSDADAVEKAFAKEREIREQKNITADERRAAEKALENITAQIAEIDTPQGDINTIKNKLEELRRMERDLNKKISDAQANERVRTELSGLTESLPDAEKECEYLTEQLAKATGTLEDAKAKVEDLPDYPEMKMKRVADKDVQEVLRGVADRLSDINVEDDDVPKIMECITTLIDLLPDPVAENQFKETWNAVDEQVREAKHNLKIAEENANELQAKHTAIVEQITKAREAGLRLASIGPGVNHTDVDQLNALTEKITAAESMIEPLTEARALSDAAEKARMTVQTLTEKQDAELEKLREAEQGLFALVDAANEQLCVRSTEVLPYGGLVMETSGKDLNILWDMGEGKLVRRHTLSGGEKAVFDAAVGHALSPNACVVIEAAEVDDEHIIMLLENLATHPFQVIVLTCHKPPYDPSDSWNVIKMD